MKTDESKELPSLKILLVEDNEHDRTAFHRAFKNAEGSYEIAEFERAEEALARLSVNPSQFDILVADYMLPEMNGLELCRELLKKRITIPMVILTGTGSEQIAVEALKSGVDDYIVKDPGKGYLKLLQAVLPEVVKRFGAKRGRKRAEENLKKEFRLRTALLDNMPGCIALILRKDTHEIVASNRLARETGAVPGRTCYESCAMRDDACPFCLAPKLWKTGEVQRLEVEYRGTWYEGIWALLSEDLYIHYIFDINEKKNLEAQLIDSRKMKAITVLAGGIAHQFNNDLTPVSVNLDMLEMGFQGDERFIRYTRPIRESIRHLVDLTRQLSGFAGSGKFSPRAIDLPDFVKKSLPIYDASTNRESIVEMDFHEGIRDIVADPGQLQMVLSIVLENAFESIEDKGTVRITIENKEIDEEFARNHSGLKVGPYVSISIQDNGKGMDEETLKRIFEPFFTTKFQGRGLGLAAAYGMIKNHSGLIAIESGPAKGTTVRIYLPAIEEGDAGAAVTPADRIEREKQVVLKPGATEDKGTILVIEDVKLVMDAARMVLEKMGYHVLEARTGKEAIDILKTHAGDIDLAILDMKLPDMRGEKVYSSIRQARPDMKVIICSGYAFDDTIQKILNKGADGFIQKPFTFKTLSRKVKEVF